MKLSSLTVGYRSVMEVASYTTQCHLLVGILISGETSPYSTRTYFLVKKITLIFMWTLDHQRVVWNVASKKPSKKFRRKMLLQWAGTVAGDML